MHVSERRSAISINCPLGQSDMPKLRVAMPVCKPSRTGCTLEPNTSVPFPPRPLYSTDASVSSTEIVARFVDGHSNHTRSHARSAPKAQSTEVRRAARYRLLYSGLVESQMPIAM